MTNYDEEIRNEIQNNGSHISEEDRNEFKDLVGFLEPSSEKSILEPVREPSFNNSSIF